MIKGTVTTKEVDHGWAALKRRFRQQSSVVKIGVQEDESQTLLVIAAANEFGATINHPGGTPYIIGKDGKAKFVSLSRGGKVAGFTKPHKITIPARSYIRSNFDENEDNYDRLVETLYGRIIDGDLEVFAGLEIVGLKVEADIKRKMVTLKSPANAPSTIRKKKGEDNPLIDQGTLLNSIRFVVE
jgi:hypothetical protein